MSQPLWEHGIFGTISLPDAEADQHGRSKDERGEDVCASPRSIGSLPIACPGFCQLLRPTNVCPMYTYRHEKDHAADGKDTTDIIDLIQDFSLSKSGAVNSRRRWEIENCCHDKTDNIPDAAEEANPAPCTVIRDQLSPEDRGTERNDGEDKHGHVFSSLRCGSKLGSDSQTGQFVDTGSNACEHHSANEDVHGVSG